MAAAPECRPAISIIRRIWSQVAPPTQTAPASSEPSADLHQAHAPGPDRASPLDSDTTVPGGKSRGAFSPKASKSSRGTQLQVVLKAPAGRTNASAAAALKLVCESGVMSLGAPDPRGRASREPYFLTPMNRPRAILPAWTLACMSDISTPRPWKTAISPPRIRRASKVNCSVSMAR